MGDALQFPDDEQQRTDDPTVWGQALNAYAVLRNYQKYWRSATQFKTLRTPRIGLFRTPDGGRGPDSRDRLRGNDWYMRLMPAECLDVPRVVVER